MYIVEDGKTDLISAAEFHLIIIALVGYRVIHTKESNRSFIRTIQLHPSKTKPGKTGFMHFFNLICVLFFPLENPEIWKKVALKCINSMQEKALGDSLT